MHLKQLNPKTNKNEKMIQCTACFEWVFISEYSNHKCEERQQNLGIMNM